MTTPRSAIRTTAADRSASIWHPTRSVTPLVVWEVDEEARLRLAGKHLLGISDPKVQLAPRDQVLQLLDDPPDVAVPGQLRQLFDTRFRPYLAN
jgi:hypothetical protein